MFKEDPPSPVDLESVPDAQQPSNDNSEPDIDKHREWSSKVSTGVTQIIQGRRGNFMPTSAKLDLCACLNLHDGTEDLKFDWDTSIYTSPPPLKLPRLPTDKVGLLPGDKPYRLFEEPDEDYDEDGLDLIARPELNMGEVRVAKLTMPPFWAMIRLLFHADLECWLTL